MNKNKPKEKTSFLFKLGYLLGCTIGLTFMVCVIAMGIKFIMNLFW